MSQTGSRAVSRQSQQAARTSQAGSRASPDAPRASQAASRMSQVSGQSAGLSRTPSADRELLGELTTSPPPRDDAKEEEEKNDDDDDDATPTPTPMPRQESIHSQGRRSSRLNVVSARDTVMRIGGNEVRTPGGTIKLVNGAKESSSRQSGASSAASGTDSGSGSGYGSGSGSRSSSVGSSNSTGTIKLPSALSRIEGNDWQSGKTVIQCNEYMLKYEVLTDVLFMVGETREEVRAHKYVLMSRSPVLFKSLVKQINNPSLRIAVPDMSVEVFRELLQYMYTDEFDIDTTNVAPMLQAAKKFQLKGLMTLCFQHLNSELENETVCKIMEQAHQYNENVLFEKCKRHIFMNGNAVLKNGTFGELCSECVAQVVKSDELRADEENVFEACMTWATAAVKRLKKQATDENKRSALGDILYLIRFPIMDVQYFTQKVSLGNVLSHDETLSIFQYFHGEIQQLPNRFSRSPRTRIPKDLKDNEVSRPIMLPEPNKADMIRFCRFPSHDGIWKQNGPPDAISFRVSEPIVLYGIELYGVSDGQATYSVQLHVYDDISREEVRKNDASIFTSAIKETYDVFLARPIRIPARRIFTIMIIMKGNPTRKGVDGEPTIVQEGMTMEFMESSRSSNGTGVAVGQIPGILFNKAQ